MSSSSAWLVNDFLTYIHIEGGCMLYVSHITTPPSLFWLTNFLALCILLLLTILLTIMPKQRCLPKEPDRLSWSMVDLLEFIRLAFLALLFFMTLTNGLNDQNLVVMVLNGQGHLMVHASLFFSLF